MIKSPFKAIVICVLLDKKISKNPAFPADMITQGGHCLCNIEQSFPISAQIFSLTSNVQVGATNNLTYTVSTVILSSTNFYLSATRNNNFDKNSIYAFYVAVGT